MANTLNKKNPIKRNSDQKFINSEEKYQSIIDNANDLIAVYNEKFECEFVNEEVLKRIMGYSFEEIKGEKSIQIIHPDDLDKAKKIFCSTFEDGEGFGESRVKCKDGSYKCLQSKGKIFKKNGLKKLILISRDITERKKIEQNVKDSEEKFKLLMCYTNDLIAILNKNFEHEFINEKAYIKVLGYSVDDVIGKRPRDFTHPGDFKRVSKAIKRGLLKGELTEEFRIRHKKGHYLWFETKGTLLKEKGIIKGAIFISRDITERKEAQQNLLELNKLKSEFLRKASHELKTPLVSIKGCSDLILSLHQNQLNLDVISKLEEINKGCYRLQNIISNLLKSSKLESPDFELRVQKENLSTLLKICVNELNSLAEAKNQLINLKVIDEIFIEIDKEEICEVVLNLLTNAIKYSPSGGKIEVKTEIKKKKVIVSFKDNGIGFTESEKKKIFKQFGKIARYEQESDIEIEGTGLGLYISKKIIESHGGKIWMESEGRNKGSIFYFSLPFKKN